MFFMLSAYAIPFFFFFFFLVNFFFCVNFLSIVLVTKNGEGRTIYWLQVSYHDVGLTLNLDELRTNFRDEFKGFTFPQLLYISYI